jgi:U3 small nucleolar RNA-associated protein 20
VELNDILTLSTFFSGALSPILVNIVERMLPKAEDVEEEKLASFAWALGACMKTLAKRDISEWSDKVDLASWTRACLDPWAWSHDVLAGLHALSQMRFVLLYIHSSLPIILRK